MCVIFHIREVTNTLREEIEFGSSRSSLLQINWCIFVNPFIHLIMSYVESSKMLLAKQIPTPFIKFILFQLTSQFNSVSSNNYIAFLEAREFCNFVYR
jgi:hypothetical protein